MYAPVGYWLVGAGEPAVALLAGAVMVWLTMLPDVDHRLPLVRHRGPTHSLAFAALVGLVLGGVGHLLGDGTVVAGRGLPEFGFALGFLSVAAHLLADALTPAGVNLLWPLSNHRTSLSVARAGDPVANAALFALGLFAVAAAGVRALGLA